MSDMILCACGCGGERPATDARGNPRRYLPGHPGRPRRFESQYEYRRVWASQNRRRVSTSVGVNRRRKRAELIVLAGGKCIECGIEYDGRNGPIFEFHHVGTKKFPLTLLTMDRKRSDVLEELDRCQLICANCHYELHQANGDSAHSRRKAALLQRVGRSCQTCGFSPSGEAYAMMHFHHRNGDDKTTEIGKLLQSSVKMKTANEEIDKCVLLCANCHRIEHSGPY